MIHFLNSEAGHWLDEADDWGKRGHDLCPDAASPSRNMLNAKPEWREGWTDW